MIIIIKIWICLHLTKMCGITFYFFFVAGEALWLWFLCPSHRRNAKKKVPCRHSILDGTWSYIKKTLRDGGSKINSKATIKDKQDYVSDILLFFAVALILSLFSWQAIDDVWSRESLRIFKLQMFCNTIIINYECVI